MVMKRIVQVMYVHVHLRIIFSVKSTVKANNK